jgi:hypothetical protein
MREPLKAGDIVYQRVGDTVYRQHGTTDMEITSIEGDLATCIWVQDGYTMEGLFLLDTLLRVSPKE